MIASQLLDIASWSSGALIAGVPSDTLEVLSTDSRSLAKGDAFLALKGENFDGHDFVKKAIEAGATTLILSDLPPETVAFPGNIIHVRKTLRALQDIALHYRRRKLPELRAIGVTGSNGKTSTKDFLKAVLSEKGPVNATIGNLNNHIGLPLTVLNTTAEDRYGIWEMGMNHPGEIGPLAEIAAPDAAVITNIGTAHIEHMKTREAIANEKAALPQTVPKDGFCVMPASDDYFEHVRSLISCEMIGVDGPGSAIQSSHLETESGGVSFDLVIEGKSARVSLPVPGRHMVMNALLAAAVGFREGLSIEQIAGGLSGTELTDGRLEQDQWNDVSILNDSYNANPDSMKAALLCLAESPGEGRKIAVLGFMGELGEHEESGHREVGEFAAREEIDLLVTVFEKGALIAEGAESKIPTQKFESHADAAAYLRSELRAGDTVLVKGSRAAEMEKVIKNLKE